MKLSIGVLGVCTMLGLGALPVAGASKVADAAMWAGLTKAGPEGAAAKKAFISGVLDTARFSNPGDYRHYFAGVVDKDKADDMERMAQALDALYAQDRNANVPVYFGMLATALEWQNRPQPEIDALLDGVRSNPQLVQAAAGARPSARGDTPATGGAAEPGLEPYTPTKLEWLVTELQAAPAPAALRHVVDLRLRLTYRAEPPDTVIVMLSALPGLPREMMQAHADAARMLVNEVAARHGWDWVVVRDRIEIMEGEAR